jgi:exopolysaccharide biosynthesis protein
MEALHESMKRGAAVWLWWMVSLISSAAESLPPLTWEPLFEGVAKSAWTQRQPRPMRVQVLKIDLKSPGISFLATPANGEKAGETDGLKTTSFLKKYQLQAAINAAPYAPVPLFEGGPMEISGLQISEGSIVSAAPNKGRGYPALLISKNNQVRIAQPPFTGLDSVVHAVSGFHVVLQKGIVPKGKPDLHPRTAVGLGEKGQRMYWLVVDGRQTGVSEGATTEELGKWFQALGCTDAINLDGGGTTTLVVADHKGGAKILNKPVHLGIPGNERVSGSHLGLKAPPLSKP